MWYIEYNPFFLLNTTCFCIHVDETVCEINNQVLRVGCILHWQHPRQNKASEQGWSRTKAELVHPETVQQTVIIVWHTNSSGSGCPCCCFVFASVEIRSTLPFLPCSREMYEINKYPVRVYDYGGYLLRHWWANNQLSTSMITLPLSSFIHFHFLSTLNCLYTEQMYL